MEFKALSLDLDSISESFSGFSGALPCQSTPLKRDSRKTRTLPRKVDWCGTCIAFRAIREVPYSDTLGKMRNIIPYVVVCMMSSFYCNIAR